MHNCQRNVTNDHHIGCNVIAVSSGLSSVRLVPSLVSAKALAPCARRYSMHLASPDCAA